MSSATVRQTAAHAVRTEGSNPVLASAIDKRVIFNSLEEAICGGSQPTLSAALATCSVRVLLSRAPRVVTLFKNPDFGSHTQPPILYKDHFYSQDTTNERSDGLAAMSIDGQVKWKTEQQPSFVIDGMTMPYSALFKRSWGMESGRLRISSITRPAFSRRPCSLFYATRPTAASMKQSARLNERNINDPSDFLPNGETRPIMGGDTACSTALRSSSVRISRKHSLGAWRILELTLGL